jgi:hypothetical protein
MRLLSFIAVGFFYFFSLGNGMTEAISQSNVSTNTTLVKQYEARYIPVKNPVTTNTNLVNPPLETPKSYTNMNDEVVQSPTRYAQAPEGACALCGDGTYSFSRNRRGTCSRHGGVAKWLNNY